MNNDLNQYSRSGNRAKRRKTNLVLNTLIIFVLALIIFVAYNIFVSGNDETASTKKETPKTEQNQVVNKEKKDNTTSSEEEAAQEVTTNENESSQDPAADEEKQAEEGSNAEEKADDSKKVVSDGGSSANVQRTIENPTWKPVGTSQTGEHTPVYDSSSVDWQEMLNAITYATGLDQNNMTVWFLGRDRSTTNASIGTVSSKDKQQKYKVYIKWVDGQGWMPTKVEELAEIPR